LYFTYFVILGIIGWLLLVYLFLEGVLKLKIMDIVFTAIEKHKHRRECAQIPHYRDLQTLQGFFLDADAQSLRVVRKNEAFKLPLRDVRLILERNDNLFSPWNRKRLMACFERIASFASLHAKETCTEEGLKILRGTIKESLLIITRQMKDYEDNAAAGKS